MTPPSTRHENVSCPFCGLACDDLTLEVAEDGVLSMDRESCSRAHDGFTATPFKREAEINGAPVAYRAALEEAARRLAASRMPVFGGMAADVAGLKALLALGEDVGAVIDHEGGDGMFANIGQMRKRGWYTATVAEIANRADCMIVFGVGREGWPPRFLERCLWRKKALFAGEARKRVLALVGEGLAAEKTGAPPGARVETVEVAGDSLMDAVSALRILGRGEGHAKAPPSLSRVLDLAPLKELLRRLAEADYGVIVWDAGAFPQGEAPLLVENICGWIDDLNASGEGRYAGFPLGGAGNAAAAAQVACWQTGFPLRLSYAGGTLRHEPWLYSSLRLCGDGLKGRDGWASGWLKQNGARKMPTLGGGDLLLWVEALAGGAQRLPEVAEGVTLICLGRPSLQLSPPPDIFLPVGAPGLDHAGVAVRMDGVASLPLASLRDGELLPVADIAGRLRNAVAAGRRG